MRTICEEVATTSLGTFRCELDALPGHSIHRHRPGGLTITQILWHTGRAEAAVHYGRCPECWKGARLNRDGTIAAHQARGAPCIGRGTFPCLEGPEST